MISALVTVFPGDELISEVHACVGIDVQGPAPAPLSERIRIDIRFLGKAPLTDELIQDILSLMKPCFIEREAA